MSRRLVSPRSSLRADFFAPPPLLRRFLHTRISNTARSSLFAFRLQLHPTSSTSLPFTQLAEFPVDQAMSSFHISIFSSDFEIYSVSPHGIDQIFISDACLRDVFVSPSSSIAAATEVELDQEEEEPDAMTTLIIKTEEVEISLDAPSSPVEEDSKPSAVNGGGTSSTSLSNATPTTVGRSRRRAKAAAAAAATIPPPEDSFGRSQVASSSGSAVPGAGEGGGGGVSSGLLAEIKKVEENIKTKVSALLEKQSEHPVFSPFLLLFVADNLSPSRFYFHSQATDSKPTIFNDKKPSSS